MNQIVFWQTVVSPHMTNLALELAHLGAEVTYIAGRAISKEREEIGWKPCEIPGVNLVLIENDHVNVAELTQSFPIDAVHLVQGLRGNKYIGTAISKLKQRGARWGAIVETIDERSLNWPLKRLVYRGLLSRWASRPDFILAIGANTPDWFKSRGFPADRTFPFAYFLMTPANKPLLSAKARVPFRIGFVGNLIPGKRVDLLIDALAGLDHLEFELIIVGDGPLRSCIEQKARKKLGEQRIEMTGIIPMSEIPSVMASLDCLVLPSGHDGWGGVVSEALLVGTPAICSDACGAAAAVNASGVGGVFATGDVEALSGLICKLMDEGPHQNDKRRKLAEWAKCLSGLNGAIYLKNVIEFCYNGGEKPPSFWRNNAQ